MQQCFQLETGCLSLTHYTTEGSGSHRAGNLFKGKQIFPPGQGLGTHQGGLVLLGCSLVIMLFEGGILGSRGGNLGERVVNTRLVAQITEPRLNQHL